MRLLDLPSFRQWAERQGMGWRDWGTPQFGNDPTASPWPWPKPDGYTRPWYLADLIVDALEAASLGQNDGFYLCPPHGRWYPGDGRPFYRIRDAILVSIGIPTDFEGVAYFAHTEIDQVAAAVFAHCFMIDECVGDGSDDAFIYPGHGRMVVQFDHEEMMWGMAANREPLQEFDQRLERLGWGWQRDRERNQSDWLLEDLA